MKSITCVFNVYGKSFSPTQAEMDTGLLFSRKREPGEVRTTGPFRGQPVAAGSAAIDFEVGRHCLDQAFLDWVHALGKVIPTLKTLGAEDMIVVFLVGYNPSFYFVLEHDLLEALARLGIDVECDTWLDTSLPDDTWYFADSKMLAGLLGTSESHVEESIKSQMATDFVEQLQELGSPPDFEVYLRGMQSVEAEICISAREHDPMSPIIPTGTKLATYVAKERPA
ncbi:MAG: hypothetical protein AB1646_09720 [Thermodesulfobacteriota bacterium]